jgi:methylthioribose-1-phosphate isomerase
MWKAIKELCVRGAPLIGVAAALCIAYKATLGTLSLHSIYAAKWTLNITKGASKTELEQVAEYLKTARPTAVNLMYCCDAILSLLKDYTVSTFIKNVFHSILLTINLFG